MFIPTKTKLFIFTRYLSSNIDIILRLNLNLVRVLLYLRACKFSKFYRRYYDLISKFQVGLKSLLRQGLLEPDYYGDLVYKLKKIVGSFSAVH